MGASMATSIAAIAEGIGTLLLMAVAVAAVFRAWKWAARLGALALVAIFVSVHGPSWLP